MAIPTLVPVSITWTTHPHSEGASAWRESIWRRLPGNGDTPVRRKNKEVGIDPVWFAVIFIINMELALITPPAGLNLYVILGIVHTTIDEVLNGAFPFMILLALTLTLIILFTALSLWLPAYVQ